jgi:TIR domain
MAAMRTLQIVPASAGTAAAGTRRVFVSYSHRDGPMAGDGDLPGAVVRALHALAEDQPELGLSPDRIFFDRAALMAGDDWNDAILSEIQRTDVFLLLVSFNSVTSRFCIKEELSAAVRHGVPVIIPVLLSECTWSGHLIVGDTRGRNLGALGAVPKDENGNFAPIKSPAWPDRETALTRTVQQIARRLTRDSQLPAAAVTRAAAPAPAAAAVPLQAPAPALPPATPAKALPPFLPFLCNQDRAVGSFNQGIAAWETSTALLVLVKGLWDDDTEGFLGRLWAKNLHDFCTTQATAVLEPRPLSLPQAMDGARARKGVETEVRAALSEALFNNLFRIKSGAQVAEALAALPGVLPLLATLPMQSDDANVAVLRALLDLVEDVPVRTPLDRLVIAVQVADPALIAEPSLRKRLRLERRRRVQVVELAALEPVDREDVRLWHSAQQLGSRVDQVRLLSTLFAGSAELRMRPFDHSVRPLLGL